MIERGLLRVLFAPKSSAGTETVSWFVVVAVALTWPAPKVTVFADVVLKPVPKMVTDDPMGPLFGVNSLIETVVVEERRIV